MGADHQIADQATIESARTGDRDALGALWRIYQPQVMRLLRAKRAASPDDIASQVWIDVGRALDRFTGDGRDFQRWIFTIAGRRSTDAARRRARQSDRLRALASEETSVHLDPDPGSVDHALALVSSLPPTMAEAVMLRVVHDLPVDEAASIMNTSEGNVRVLVHRGITKLRTAMAEPTTAAAPSRDLQIAELSEIS